MNEGCESLVVTEEEKRVENNLINKGSVCLGGTGEMYLYADGNDNSYLFKPAVSKYGNEQQTFRAYIQESAYRVQKLVDPNSAVYCKSISLDGRFGAVQEKITKHPCAFNLLKWQREGGELPSDIANQLLREYITDYLLCNFDSHARNFIIGEDGILRGVDKEQSFKYISDIRSKKPSKQYKPNALEPIYNTMFRRYVEGSLYLDLKQVNIYIEKVESVESFIYREIFRGYSESLKGNTKDSEKLLDLISERRENIKDNIYTFFDTLEQERSDNKLREKTEHDNSYKVTYNENWAETVSIIQMLRADERLLKEIDHRYIDTYSKI